MKKYFILGVSLLLGANFCAAMHRTSLAELLDKGEVGICVQACCVDFCPLKNQPLCPRMCYALTKWTLISSMAGCGLIAYATMDEPNILCCSAAAAACLSAYGADKADKLIHVSEFGPTRMRMKDEDLEGGPRDFQILNSRYRCSACNSVLDSAGLDEEVGLRLYNKKKK